MSHVLGSAGRPADAFISYSHRGERDLARSLEKTLWTFGRRWYQIRGLATYRDETNLSAEPDLWPTIEREVQRSRCLVLLASPESARSEWVPREVDAAVKVHGISGLCIVQTAGVLPWTDRISGSEMLQRDDGALGPSVWQHFDTAKAQPLVVDLRSFRSIVEKRRRNDPEYLSRVAAIAAKALGKDKETIWGEYHRAQRLRTIFLGTVSALLMGLVVALGLVLRSEREQRRTANEQRTRAEEERANAVHNEQLARRHLYAANINLAQEAWRKDDCARLSEILGRLRPADASSPDLRGFEWRYLLGLCHSESQTLPNRTAALAFAPRGDLLVIGSLLWNPRTREPIDTLKGVDSIVSAAFSADGTLLAYGSFSGVVRVRNVTTGGEDTLKYLPPEEPDGVVQSLALSKDGRRLAVAVWSLKGEDNVFDEVRLWSLGRRPAATRLPRVHSTVRAITFDPTGKRVAIASGSGTLRGTLTGGITVVDATTKRVISQIQESEWVLAVAFSPDGTVLASGDSAGNLTVRNARSLQVVKSIPGDGANQLTSLAFSEDGRTLITGGWKGVDLWDVASWRRERSLAGHTSIVEAVALAADGKHAASAGYDGVKLWDLERVPGQRIIQTSGQEIHSLRFAKTKLIAATEGTVQQWDFPNAGLGVEPLPRSARDSVTALAVDPRGATIATLSRPSFRDDPVVRVWGVKNRWKRAGRLKHHGTDIASITLLPGKKLLSCGRSGPVTLWKLLPRSVRSLATFGGRDDFGCLVASSTDARLLAWIGARSATVKLWDVASRRLLKERTFTVQPEVLSFSPDGSLLAIGMGTGREPKTEITGQIVLWDTSTGDERTSTLRQKANITAVEFTPDGRSLAAGRWDGTVTLFDPVTLQELLTLDAHHGRVTALTFAQDGSALVSGGADGKIVAWQGSQ